MNDKNKTIISTTLLAGIGIGVCFLFAKYRHKIIKKLRTTLDYRNPLRHQNIQIINTAEECRQIVQQIKLHCNEYNVIGFDCEWVTVGGTRRPIALMQLATHRGLCALIRLCLIKFIPIELKQLLEDSRIIKVGVVPLNDANYLHIDYGLSVASTLDLRHLAEKRNFNAVGLAKMSKTHLNIELDKNWRLACSNWENSQLTDTQVLYAAKDAHVAIELFKIFAEHKRWFKCVPSKEDILDDHEIYLNVPFNANKKSNTTSRTSSQKESINNYKEIPKRFMSTRSTPLYDNCLLQAPDGELLCTCDKKKANWYIQRDLATIIAESPQYTVRLNFEPSGRAAGQVGKFYQIPKENQCVVCGKSESYIRKHIIPLEYRKQFPDIMKSHMSHDILLLCPLCHQKSNISDLKIRHDLAKLCDAPFLQKDGGVKIVADLDLKRQKSRAKALLYNSHKIPETRLNELRAELLEYYPPNTIITEELLKEASEIDIYEENPNYLPHGQRVVDYFKMNENGGLTALERIWRQHFLDTMKPKYLPELWSVEHNAERLEIRADEGRIDECDLQIAGIRQKQKSNVSIENDVDEEESIVDAFNVSR